MPTERQTTLHELTGLLRTAYVPADLRAITEVIVHHTWKPTAKNFQGISTVKGVRVYHMSPTKKLKGTCPYCFTRNNFRYKALRRGWICNACGNKGGYGRGWSDNGYHIMLGPSGEIFLCRPITRSGGHTLGHNAHSIGVSYIANFDVQRPSTYDGMRTGQQVIAALLEHFGLDETKVRFHREFATKSCPGTKLYLDSYREGVRLLMSDAPKIVLLPGSKVIACRPQLEDGVTRVDLRTLAEDLGCEK